MPADKRTQSTFYTGYPGAQMHWFHPGAHTLFLTLCHRHETKCQAKHVSHESEHKLHDTTAIDALSTDVGFSTPGAMEHGI